MTAINVLLQREAGHLVTDAAWYDLDGVLRNIAPKSQVVGHWPGAIAARGPGLANALIATEAGMAFADFDAFVLGAGAFLANWCEREANYLADWLEQGHVELIAVGWSKAQDRPRAVFLSSKDEGVEAAARGIEIDTETQHLAQPFEIEAGYVRPLPEPEALAFYKVDPGADFDEVQSIAAYAGGIICAQRECREPILPGGEPVCFVGGYLMMTTATRYGVSVVKGAHVPGSGRPADPRRAGGCPEPSPVGGQGICRRRGSDRRRRDDPAAAPCRGGSSQEGPCPCLTTTPTSGRPTSQKVFATRR